MTFTHKNGNITYYQSFGDKSNPLLLMLHGIGADSEMFSFQTEALSNLGYYVVVPDLIGHGKSSKIASLSLDTFSNQILDLSNDLLKEKISLLGVSMGGVIAMYIAANSPNKISKLIICDSFGQLKSKKEKMLGKSQILGFKMFKKLGNKALANGMAKTYKADYAAKASEYFKKVSMEVDFDQLILARYAINEIDVLETLKSNDYDALCLCGKDFGDAFIDINLKIADALKTKLILMDNAMDPSNLVNPTLFNSIVSGFLKEF